MLSYHSNVILLLFVCARTIHFGETSAIGIPPIAGPNEISLLKLEINDKKYDNDFFKTGSKFKTAVVKLKSFINNQYMGEVGIGNPPQMVNLIFDTGSSDMWVPARVCKGKISNNFYDSNRSITYKPDDAPFKVVYVIGATRGHWSIDDFHLGGLRVRQQRFGVATEVSVDHYSKYDGLMGLNFARNKTTPLMNLFEQGLIEKPIFGVYLRRDCDSIDGGEIMFGGIDKSRFTGPITYAPLTRATSWQFRVDSITIGLNGSNFDDDRQVVSVCNGGCAAILDTGSSFLIGPKNQVDELEDKLGVTKLELGSPRAMLHGKLSSLFDLIITIEGRRFVLKPEDYMIGTKKLKNKQILYTNGFHTMKENLWVLGDTFIGKYYSIFDHGNRRIGLAEKV